MSLHCTGILQEVVGRNPEVRRRMQYNNGIPVKDCQLYNHLLVCWRNVSLGCFFFASLLLLLVVTAGIIIRPH